MVLPELGRSDLPRLARTIERQKELEREKHLRRQFGFFRNRVVGESTFRAVRKSGACQLGYGPRHRPFARLRFRRDDGIGRGGSGNSGPEWRRPGRSRAQCERGASEDSRWARWILARPPGRRASAAGASLVGYIGTAGQCWPFQNRLPQNNIWRPSESAKKKYDVWSVRRIRQP